MIAPTLNDEFELPEGSYSVSVIQDYTENISEKCEALSTIPPIHGYVNKFNNRLVSKIKDGYKLERLNHRSYLVAQKNKSYAKLLNVGTNNLVFLKAHNTEVD